MDKEKEEGKEEPQLALTSDQKKTAQAGVGRLAGQSAFTLYGCDLTTGEPKAEMAGLPQCRHRQ